MGTPKSGNGSTFFVAVAALQILGDYCAGLRLTNMTAPALQDPRKEMELHCRFDMGGEELYAVKWYKDDHEFFRYTPADPVKIIQFPVRGVHVDQRRSSCMAHGCDLLLNDLSRPESSGAYRCEVSSEAPAFRLASQTHNVTVAVIPDERPKIDGLRSSYLLQDVIEAYCTSGLGDPKPILTWYVNKQPMSGKNVRELPFPESHLKGSKLLLKLTLDKKTLPNLVKHPLEVTCESSTEGISQILAPPLATTKTVTVTDPTQQVNNQKFHSPFSTGSKVTQRIATVVFLVIVLRWC